MPAETSLLTSVPLLIFKRGDPGGSIFIVASGEVEILVEDTIGQRIVFETAKTDDFFGELSLLDGDPRSASALAIGETRPQARRKLRNLSLPVL